MSGTETLAKSLAYKGTMAGLPQKGNMMSYMSKDFADLIIRLHGIANANGMIEGLDAEMKEAVDKSLVQLKNINQGAVSTLTRSADGIHMSARSTENFQEMIAEFKKMMEKL